MERLTELVNEDGVLRRAVVPAGGKTIVLGVPVGPSMLLSIPEPDKFGNAVKLRQPSGERGDLPSLIEQYADTIPKGANGFVPGERYGVGPRKNGKLKSLVMAVQYYRIL